MFAQYSLGSILKEIIDSGSSTFGWCKKNSFLLWNIFQLCFWRRKKISLGFSYFSEYNDNQPVTTKELFTKCVSNQRGGGFFEMLTFADKRARGGKIIIFLEEMGAGVSEKLWKHWQNYFKKGKKNIFLLTNHNYL